MELPLDRGFYRQLPVAGELKATVQEGLYDETSDILRKEVWDAVLDDVTWSPQPNLMKFLRGCRVAN
jgi:hypothetical protein